MGWVHLLLMRVEPSSSGLGGRGGLLANPGSGTAEVKKGREGSGSVCNTHEEIQGGGRGGSMLRASCQKGSTGQQVHSGLGIKSAYWGGRAVGQGGAGR